MRRRSVKSWMVRLGLCMLAGAVVTWAVAWGCVLWGAFPIDITPTREPWPDGVPAEWPPPSECIQTSAFGKTERWWATSDERGRAQTWEFGWPLRSMRHSLITEDMRGVKVTGATAPTWLFPNPHCIDLPTEVLPLGFALNTAFFALLLLGTVEGAGLARRRSRTRRGRCPACNYDRRGLPTRAACPECGTVNA